MPNKKLTVIIPFLNEKYEVENTIKSIKNNSTNEVEIMLINDASDDGFDYRTIAEKYEVIYIENSSRLGVASSRDLGVEKCNTPYFLLLDAHMRFYDSLWVKRIIEELIIDEKSLLCCQTKPLGLEDGVLVNRYHNRLTYGAYLKLNENKLIEPVWNYKIDSAYEQLNTIPIVCVLGAGYACSKKYWVYLKGLSGLEYYGSDEAYISMKVWQEGGKCKLLTDVVIGHIYRTNTKIPYSTKLRFPIFNKLFLVELFFPSKLKKETYSKAKLNYKNVLPYVIHLLFDKREEIFQMKSYYKKIFKKDFSVIQNMNDKHYRKSLLTDRSVEKNDNFLNNISKTLINSSTSLIGMTNGRMGIATYLFHYSRFYKLEQIEAKAERMLAEVIENIRPDSHYCFLSGLCGIGWTIEYLYHQGFIKGDINEILEDFDKKVMEINPEKIVDNNRDFGLGGVVLYILARLYSIENKGCKNPFDNDYLTGIYNRACSIIECDYSECDSLSIYLEFIFYFEGKVKLPKPELYDICSLSNHENIPLQELNNGLDGLAGIGLKMIFEKENSLTNFKDTKMHVTLEE